MGDGQAMHSSPRPRPVADLPLDSLLAHSEDLARRWASALVLARPLEELGELPLAELAHEAPGLCAQVLRALESEAELERLTGRTLAPAPGGPSPESAVRRLHALCSAGDAAVLVDAVEALRGVLWEALLAQIAAPPFERSPGRQATDACDRLSYVCASVLRAAVGGAKVERAAGVPQAQAGLAGAGTAETGQAAAPRPARLLIIDERPRAAEPGAPAERAHERPPTRDRRARDERPPWIVAIARELEHFRRDARPFAVLLVELGNLARLSGAESPQRSAQLAADAERVLAAELRQAAGAGADGRDLRAGAHPGSLTRERPGRYWLLAPDTDRNGATELARRLQRSAARPVSHGGGLGEVAIGTAVCPEDGSAAAALAEHADLELYSARAGAPAGGRDRSLSPEQTA